MKDMKRNQKAAMAWERAKGELNSIKHLFMDEDGDDYDEYTKAVDEFIEDVEGYAHGGFL